MSQLDETPLTDDSEGSEPEGEPTEATDPDDAVVLDADELDSAEGDGDVAASESKGVRSRLESRSRKRKEWTRTERARRYAARRSVRFPIFTRSVLLWTLLFALVGLAFGASGALWWAHFNTQVEELREETKDFEQRAQNALSSIDAQRNEALREIQESTEPVVGVLAQSNMVKLAERFEPSVWVVTTKDAEGRATLGSAFSVISNEDESVLVTSYSLVQAAAVAPGPGISIRKVTEEVTAELWAIDPEHDLALLKVNRGDIPVLEWANDEQQRESLGTSAFAISAQGGNGAVVSPGLVLDVSTVGIRHDAKLDFDFRGGPIVTPQGKVLAVATLNYNPTNVQTTGELHYAPLVSSTCLDLFICGGGVRETKEKEGGLPPPTDDDGEVVTVTGDAPGS